MKEYDLSVFADDCEDGNCEPEKPADHPALRPPWQRAGGRMQP